MTDGTPTDSTPPSADALPEIQPGAEMRLPLLEHLNEFRSRLIRCLLALLAGTALSFNKADEIFHFLLTPLIDQLPVDSRKLIFTELTEAFLTYFKVALWCGFILASPVIFYNLWKFIEPGLFRKERKTVGLFAMWTTLGLLAGMAFAYFIAIPEIFRFFLSFGQTIIKPMPSMREALSLVLRLLLIFGCMFELPLVLYLLGRGGLVTPALLRKGRKIAILLILVLTGILTPPDMVSQVLTAVPFYILYELGILLCAFGRRRREKALAAV